MTISPALTPAQTCAARMLSAALADSTKTKRGSRLCKSSRTWSLAAALRRRCSSPIDAGGNQGNRAGVHHVNDAPKTPRQAFTSTPSAKAGRKRLEVLKHRPDRKSTRLNSSHVESSYAVFCLKKKEYKPVPLPFSPRTS